jgi:hypothetical protein
MVGIMTQEASIRAYVSESSSTYQAGQRNTPPPKPRFRLFTTLAGFKRKETSTDASGNWKYNSCTSCPCPPLSFFCTGLKTPALSPIPFSRSKDGNRTAHHRRAHSPKAAGPQNVRGTCGGSSCSSGGSRSSGAGGTAGNGRKIRVRLAD